jgi:hypothetical protein
VKSASTALLNLRALQQALRWIHCSIVLRVSSIFHEAADIHPWVPATLLLVLIFPLIASVTGAVLLYALHACLWLV